MTIPAALSELPEALVAPGLDGAYGFRDRSRALLSTVRATEDITFCHTITAVYGLYRSQYGEAEDAYLALAPGEFTARDLIARRNDLRRRESELAASVSVALRLGSTAAELMIETAVGLVERIPRVFALVGDNVISPKHGQEALAQARVLDREQVREYDAQLARLLGDGAKLTALPALREAAKRIVTGIDPDAAERRRKYAEADRAVTFRPEDDGMASAYLLLVAQDAREFSVRVNAIAETVCEHDPRTVPQRRADGHMQLIRGCVTLGCRCGTDGCALQEPRKAGDGEVAGVITRYRTLITVVVNERTLADEANTEQGYLVGYGPITAQHARDLADREDATIRPFGDRIEEARPVGEPEPELEVEAVSESPTDGLAETEATEALASEPDAEPAVPSYSDVPAPLVTATGASGYRPSADLLRYLSLLYPRCVFPMCTRSAQRCQIDHSREYDHGHPAAGGGTEALNMQPLCVKHHQLKTAGTWIDARMPDGRIIWTGPDNERIIVDPAGTVVHLFPDLLRVEWRLPPGDTGQEEARAEPKCRTRLEREHARREEIRRRNLQAAQPKPEPAPGTVSVVEERLTVLIQAAHLRERAEAAENAPPRWRFPKVDDLKRPPEPPHPDDEPPALLTDAR